jgi:hypothetical protein
MDESVCQRPERCTRSPKVQEVSAAVSKCIDRRDCVYRWARPVVQMGVTRLYMGVTGFIDGRKSVPHTLHHASGS